MTTRIDRAVTEVIAEPETMAEGESSDPRFEELDRLRKMRRRLERLDQRTEAEGFDD